MGDQFQLLRQWCKRLEFPWERLIRLKLMKHLQPRLCHVRKLLTFLLRSNTCGGAVALGHPLAASGSRISAHIVHKLRREGQKYGIGSACIGGGQGISILFEKM